MNATISIVEISAKKEENNFEIKCVIQTDILQYTAIINFFDAIKQNIFTSKNNLKNYDLKMVALPIKQMIKNQEYQVLQEGTVDFENKLNYSLCFEHKYLPDIYYLKLNKNLFQKKFTYVDIENKKKLKSLILELLNENHIQKKELSEIQIFIDNENYKNKKCIYFGIYVFAVIFVIFIAITAKKWVFN